MTTTTDVAATLEALGFAPAGEVGITVTETSNAQAYCPVDGYYTTVEVTTTDNVHTARCLGCGNTFNATSNDPEYNAIFTLEPR